jgi:uncharacterized membrane protein
MDLWVVMRALHLLAMAFFVGGQLVLVAAVVPALRAEPDRAHLRAVARRFGYGTLVAIAVLLATGAAMAAEFEHWDDPELQAKLGLVAVVGGLVAWHIRRPAQHAIEGAIFVLSLVIVWLGISLAHTA